MDSTSQTFWLPVAQFNALLWLCGYVVQPHATRSIAQASIVLAGWNFIVWRWLSWWPLLNYPSSASVPGMDGTSLIRCMYCPGAKDCIARSSTISNHHLPLLNLSKIFFGADPLEWWCVFGSASNTPPLHLYLGRRQAVRKIGRNKYKRWNNLVTLFRFKSALGLFDFWLLIVRGQFFCSLALRHCS